MFRRSDYDPESGLPVPEESKPEVTSHFFTTQSLYQAGTMISSYFASSTQAASRQPLLSDKKSTYRTLLEEDFDTDLPDPFLEEMQETKQTTKGYYSFFYEKMLQTKEMLQKTGGSIGGYLINKAFSYSYALPKKLFSPGLSYGSIQDQSDESSQIESQAALFKQAWEAKMDIEESLYNYNEDLQTLQKLSNAIGSYILAISKCYRSNITASQFEGIRAFKNNIANNLPISIKKSAHHAMIAGLLNEKSDLYNESRKFLYSQNREKAPPAIKPLSTIENRKSCNT